MKLKIWRRGRVARSVAVFAVVLAVVIAVVYLVKSGEGGEMR